MYLKYYISLVTFIVAIFVSRCISESASAIDELRVQLIELENSSWSIVQTMNNETRDDALNRIYKSHITFATINLGVDYYENEFITMNSMYEWKYLERHIITITKLFSELRRIFSLQIQEGLDELASIDFAETVIQDSRFPLKAMLQEIYDVMVKQGVYYKGISETESNLCNVKQSTQQVLIQLYNAISVAEFKAYVMINLAWIVLQGYGRENNANEATLLQKQFEERATKTQTFLRSTLGRADRSVTRCEPSQHLEGDTYIQLTRLLQGYIENEVDLNNDGTCRETCDYYKFTESHGCFKDKYCAQQPKCQGKIINCHFIDSDMWVCPASGTNTSRRYQYIEYENGRILGKKGSCARGSVKVDSWWRWVFWHCSYCFCYCDEQGMKSDRYFSLKEVKSNTAENKVVTGMRFVKINRVVHLQIQEGELMLHGNINPDTVKWQPVDAFDLRTTRGIRNGVDYHTMTWDKRAIDLDQLTTTEKGYVVTGLKFRLVGSHLNLEMHMTEFNSSTGLLIDPQNKSIWVSNDNTETSSEKRTRVSFYKPDIPTSVLGSLVIKSKTNQFVEFTHSDIDADGAQTTVPFLDAQEVSSEPAVPLSGIGIFYKGKDRSGGFIAPKIYTYDFSTIIRTPTKSKVGNL